MEFIEKISIQDGWDDMVKIGQSHESGPNEDAPNFSQESGSGPPDPLKGLEHSLLGEDGVPKGHTWGIFSRAATEGIAQAWWGKFPTVSLNEWIQQQSANTVHAEFVTNIARRVEGFDSAVVFPTLLRNRDELGEVLYFSDSSLAPKILEYLDHKGVSGMEFPVMGMGSGLLELPKNNRWLGGWGTAFGTRTHIWFEIRKGADGSESCYMYSNLLVSTRVPSLELAQAYAIPSRAHSLIFTAETLFPSALMTMPRSGSFSDVPEELIPTAFLTIEEFGLAATVLGDNPNGTIQTDLAGYPLVVSAGYLIPESSLEHLDNIVPAVVATLTNLASIVEDGFRNYRNPTTPVPFDHMFGSELILVDWTEEGAFTGGFARWVPETHLGSLVAATRNATSQAESLPEGPEQRELLEWVCNEGAGGIVASAVNALVITYLLPEEDFDQAKFLLDRAIALEMINESTNALAKLGQVQFAQGKPEEAIETFEKALNRGDKFAEAEASFFLGLIAEEEGKTADAQEWWKRGAAAIGDHHEHHRNLCSNRLASGPN